MARKQALIEELLKQHFGPMFTEQNYSPEIVEGIITGLKRASVETLEKVAKKNNVEV